MIKQKKKYLMNQTAVKKMLWVKDADKVQLELLSELEM